MASFKVTENQLAATGILDSETEAPFKTRLKELLDSGAPEVVVDLTEVATITSTCIGALVAFWIDLSSANRKMELRASEHVKRVLDMTGLTSVLMKL